MEIPIDLQYADVEASELSFNPAQAGSDTGLDQALALIADSRRRIIIAGGGVSYGDASAALTSLAEKPEAPVFTTPNGRGAIPDDHPLAVGNVYPSRKLHADMADADLTIAIGTRFQAGVGGANAALTPPGKLLHIDVDASIINRVHKADAAVVGEAATLLPAIESAINPEPADRDFVDRVLKSNQALREILRKRLGPDYEGVLDALATAPHDALIVRDTTVPAYNFAHQLLPIYQPRSFIGPTSAAIGPGLPLSVGAAVGSGRRTIVIHGDGGFMFHATELATIAQYQLPIIICVFNDSGYGVLRGLQTQAFDGRYTETIGFVDFAMMAESMGVKGVTADSLKTFQQHFKEALKTDGPTLINVDMRQLEPMQGSILPSN